MAGKIKQAISQMIEDLGTIEGATIADEDGREVLCYARIDMDGDVISYARNDIGESTLQVQSNSIDTAITCRDALASFLINITKKL